jgi:hypothetical protein
VFDAALIRRGRPSAEWASVLQGIGRAGFAAKIAWRAESIN